MITGGCARAAGIAARLLVVVTLGVLASRANAAEPDPVLERRVKAAFLYQFVPYVEWPPSALGPPDSPIVIAVVGSDETVAELADVIGARTTKDRRVVVRRWREADLAGGPHIVYVRRQEAARLPAIARAARASGTLVVSESEGALGQGSMINFQIVDGRVRFDVALSPVETAGLRISSRLLAVARDVRSAP